MPNKKFSFVSYLSIIYLMCFFTLLGIISIFTYTFHKKTTLNLTEKWTSQITNNVYLNTYNYLNPAEKITTIIKKILQHKTNISIHNTDIQNLLINVLMEHPQFRACYIGLENGNFIMASKEEQTQLSTINQNTKLKSVTTFDKNLLKVTSYNENSNNYNPTNRDWYKGAINTKGKFWTPPYIFFSNKKIGISASNQLTSTKNIPIGVIGIDITLHNLNTFLKSLVKTKNSHILILNKDFKIVANSHSTTESKSTLLSFKDVYKTPFSFLIKQKQKNNLIELDVSGTTYIVLIKEFPNEFVKNWKTVILIPKNELLKPIIQANNQLLMISVIFIFIASIIIIFYSFSISKKIKKVSSHAMKLKNLNFDSYLNFSSNITEIELLKNTINTMQKGIKSFLHYVPQDVVTSLIKTNKEAKISGQNQYITILFTDIENFTDLSEKVSANQLAHLMSDYFENITSIIRKHNGIVDKFIGDSVMAMWGTPVKNKNHALDACKCAIEINEHWNKNKKNIFKTRIGIHTGDVIVGNIGAKDRFNYTAIGKNVNLASRIEGVNKYYHSTMIISEETYKLTKNNISVIPLDKAILQGSSSPIQLYKLLDNKHENADQLNHFVNKFTEHQNEYITKQFDNALVGFKELNQIYPNNYIISYYIKKINQAKKENKSKWNPIIKIEKK